MQENTNQSPYTYKEDHIVKNNYIDDSLTWESYVNNIKINIIEHTEDKLVFDFINANAPLANALRRIMLSEIKTFAFHDLFITENTTVFSDEFLAQRIGLIPILYDNPDKQDKSEKPDLECVLDVTNTTKENMNVYSDHIINTFDELKIKKGVLICKLAPNHKLCIRMKISMGIGNYHAKWSPVALCSYRLMPEIKLKREFFDEDARKLKECLSEGVVELEKVENTQRVRAVIKNPRLEKMSREVLRHFTSEDLELGRVNNYFIFEVESIMKDPKVILRKAIEELKRKANTLLN